MKTHIEFCSTEFPAYPDEVEQVNPDRFGKRLAEFVAQALPPFGYKIKRVIAEDWGWMVEMENDAFPLWIGCGNQDEIANGFLCFIEPSKPVIRKWFSKIDTEPTVEKLATALESVLEKSGKVSNLRWWSEDESV